MVNIIVELSKYLMIILIAAYTFSCFSVFAQHDLVRKKKILGRQNRLMFTIQLIAYLVMFLQTKELELVFFYLVLPAAAVLLMIRAVKFLRGKHHHRRRLRTFKPSGRYYR